MRRSLELTTRGRGLHDISAALARIVHSSGVRDGLCCVFLRHTSASLLITENADPSARQDLESWFERLAQDGDPSYTHTAEGPDDMSAHLRAAVTRTSETLIVSEGELVLGTWQGVFLFEHRTRPHRRVLEVKLVEG